MDCIKKIEQAGMTCKTGSLEAGAATLLLQMAKENGHVLNWMCWKELNRKRRKRCVGLLVRRCAIWAILLRGHEHV